VNMTSTCPQIKINDRLISTLHEPYVIAELSANHNGSLGNAKELVKQAKLAGADAVKLQTYTPDTITLRSSAEDFLINDGIWSGKTLYELYEEAHTPWAWHHELFDYARLIGITMFSSPFDHSAVDFLDSLGCPAFKIASFEAIDLQLIRYVASKGKPMIISTGMANAEEITEAVLCAKEGGCHQLALLHCVSAYPTPPDECNLRTIDDMRERYQLVTGLSDHSLGHAIATCSVAFGACIIEKHFTLDKDGGGPDDSFSMEPGEFKELCKNVKSAHAAIGQVSYERKSSELPNIKFRRSLYFVKALNAGDRITENCVKSVRPGYGLKPKHYDNVIGKKVKKDVQANTPVTFDILSNKKN
jgi:pseudaminic acid synthase